MWIRGALTLGNAEVSVSDRFRDYLAGVLHALAGVWIAALAVSHWGGGPFHVPAWVGQVPAPLALIPALAGMRLLLGGRAPAANVTSHPPMP